MDVTGSGPNLQLALEVRTDAREVGHRLCAPGSLERRAVSP